jgi:xenotropic and polytropic retrovirus receptor 1
MRKLRIPETNRDYHSPVLRTGLYLGLALPAFIRCCEIGKYNNVGNFQNQIVANLACSPALDPSTPTRLPNIHTNIQIYACLLLPIVFCMGFAINLMVWSRSRINYKFIFEFDPRDNLNYHQFAEVSRMKNETGGRGR